MKRLLIVPCLFLLATCATNDDYDRPMSAPPRSARFERAPGGLEIMPPPQWWRDDRIANVVNVSADQVSALDKIDADQGAAIVQLQRDSGAASRDIRAALDT